MATEGAVVAGQDAAQAVALHQPRRQRRRHRIGPGAARLEHRHVGVAVHHQARQAVGLGVHQATGFGAGRQTLAARRHRRVETPRPPRFDLPAGHVAGARSLCRTGRAGRARRAVLVEGRVQRHHAHRDARVGIEHPGAPGHAGRGLEAHELSARVREGRGGRLPVDLVGEDPGVARGQAPQPGAGEHHRREAHGQRGASNTRTRFAPSSFSTAISEWPRRSNPAVARPW